MSWVTLKASPITQKPIWLGLSIIYLATLGLQKIVDYLEASHINSPCAREFEHAFSGIHRSWRKICTSENVVLPRGDNTAVDMMSNRQWSLHSEAFQGSKHSTCKSLDELLVALKFGERKWKGREESSQGPRHHNQSIAYESSPSYFVSKECQISYISAEEACTILNKYSTVIIAGDSLGRHTAQGLMMILTEDFALGSHPRGTGLSRDVYDNCRCDGQFSEHVSCRYFDEVHLLPEDPRDYGLCTHIKGAIFKLRFAPLSLPGRNPEESSLIWQSLCVEDERPILVTLNGGAHFGSDPDQTLSKFIAVVQQRMHDANRACNRDLNFKVLWSGLNAQSRKLDIMYPHQSRENAVSFNSVVDAKVLEYGMVPLDFWNLTLDAATSDGYHYLSDVNIFKATAIVHVAKFLAP